MLITALVMQAAMLTGCSSDVVEPLRCETTQVVGHRCRTYSRERTKENTVASLKEVAKRGVRGCEIDIWRLADGKVIVWHDSTWGRVADPSTLPEGLPRLVKNATWAQVKQIRTRGGARVATFKRMIRVAGRKEVDLMIDLKNGLPDPTWWLDYAGARGVDTFWYQAPNASTCATNMIDEMAAAGAVTGLKQDNTTCHRTPEETAALGDFVADTGARLTPELVAAYQDYGLTVFPKEAGAREWVALVDAGAHIITHRPGKAVKWLSR